MSLKTKFFKMLGELDDSEKQQLKDFLEGDDPNAKESEPVVETEEEATPTEETAETTGTPEAALQEDSPKEDESAEPTMEAAVNEDFNEADEEAGATENQVPPPPVAEEEIPALSKDEPPPAEDGEIEEQPAETMQQSDSDVMMDDNGEELPIDYAEIVDAQNAKILALEAENRTLKAKVDGAFGLSMKPQGRTKVNPLYDNDISELRLRK